jgi:hypothetical protein
LSSGNLPQETYDEPLDEGVDFGSHSAHDLGRASEGVLDRGSRTEAGAIAPGIGRGNDVARPRHLIVTGCRRTEKRDDLAQKERALPSRATIDDRSGDMERFEAAYEVREREHTAAQATRVVGGQVDPTPSALFDGEREGRGPSGASGAPGLDDHVEAAAVAAEERLGQRAPRLVSGADECDPEGLALQLPRRLLRHLIHVHSVRTDAGE